MKGIPLVFMVTLLTVFTVSAALAADYYAFKNKSGKVVVLDYVPSAGWTLISGPYATSDAAKQALGIGTSGRSAMKASLPMR